MNRYGEKSRGRVGELAPNGACVFCLVTAACLMGMILPSTGAPADPGPTGGRNPVAALVESFPVPGPQEAAPKGQPAAAVQTARTRTVRIEARQALDFGEMRIKPRSSGWVVIDPGGGFNASPNVSFSSRHMPCPGQVMIEAAPESRILLGLTLSNGEQEGVFTGISAVTLVPAPHPSGLAQLTIILEADGRDEWGELPEAIADPFAAPAQAIKDRVAAS